MYTISSILIESIEFINSILTQYMYNILNYDIASFLISKKDYMYWSNIYNLIYYLLYSWIKTWLLKLYFYIIKIFIICIYNNMLNKWYGKWINSLFYIRKFINKTKKMPKGRWKAKKFRVFIFRFFYIDCFRFLLLLFSIIILILMWRRKFTYTKSTYMVNIIIFIMISMYLSFISVVLLGHSSLYILMSIIFSFIIIYCKLN